MITRIAEFVVRRRKGVLAAAAVFIVVAGAVGGGVASHLNNGGFADPASESVIAEHLLNNQFHTGDPGVVLVVRAQHGTVDTPAVAAAGRRITAALAAAPHIGQAFSYWSLGSPPPLASRDHTEAMVLARITGNDDEVTNRVPAVTAAVNAAAAREPAVHVTITGFAPVFRQVNTTIRSDLARAESIAVPITLLLLIAVFGSLVAASLPLAVGATAVVGTFLVLRLLVLVTHVSIFSLNLTTAMGLGLAIDYSLFVVSRFREELHSGKEPHAAAVRTMETAGRTVLFSALAVASSLAALLVFPLYFLRSFAYAGVAVVTVAALAAVLVLPALLAVMGHNVDKLRLFRTKPKEVGEGFWHRLALFVMRRPLPIASVIIVVLVLLGTPFLGVHFGQPDDRVLPSSASTRQGLNDIRQHFASNESFALSVVAPTSGDPATLTSLSPYAAQLSRIPGVARVDAWTGSYIGGTRVVPVSPVSKQRFGNPTGTWLSVVPAGTIEPQSPAGEHLVAEVRHTPAPFAVKVTGSSAQLVDSKRSIFGLVPLALGIIALVTLLTLFMMFGSVLVPVKAVVLNLLSLTATFGAMVWIFQEGHGSGLLHFTATGTLDTTTPILMFCVAFGLSMDYEVFLLSRIKEEHDRGADNISAVAIGLERTGRIVTAAALLFSIVLISFATSGITFIKLFGIGLTMAVLMDATLIRGTLVPAFMRLAGNANWWAPGPLRRFYERHGIRESADPEPEVPRVEVLTGT